MDDLIFFCWSKLFPRYEYRMAAMARDVATGAAFRRADLLTLEPMQ